jgi:hypothetical protein
VCGRSVFNFDFFDKLDSFAYNESGWSCPSVVVKVEYPFYLNCIAMSISQMACVGNKSTATLACGGMNTSASVLINGVE